VVLLLPKAGAGTEGDGVATGSVGLIDKKFPYEVAETVRVSPSGMSGLPSLLVGRFDTLGMLGTLSEGFEGVAGLLLLLLGEFEF